MYRHFLNLINTPKKKVHIISTDEILNPFLLIQGPRKGWLLSLALFNIFWWVLSNIYTNIKEERKNIKEKTKKVKLILCSSYTHRQTCFKKILKLIGE